MRDWTEEGPYLCSLKAVAGDIIGAAATLGGAAIGAGAAGSAAREAGDIQSQAALQAAQIQAESVREALALEREIFNITRADLAPFRETGQVALQDLAALFIPGGQERVEQEIQRNREIRDLEDTLQQRIARREQVTAEEALQPSGAGDETLGQFLNREITDLTAAIEQRRTAPATEVDVREAFETSPGFEFRVEQGEKALRRANALSPSGAVLEDLVRFNQGVASEEFNTFANRLENLAGIGQAATNVGVQAGQGFAARSGANIIAGGQARASGLLDAATATAAGRVGSANAFNRAIGQGVFAVNQLTPAIQTGINTLALRNQAREDVQRFPEIF